MPRIVLILEVNRSLVQSYPKMHISSLFTYMLRKWSISTIVEISGTLSQDMANFPNDFMDPIYDR